MPRRIRSRRPLAAALLAAGLAGALPAGAAAREPAGHEPVAEALFLCDPLPPGGRDVNASLLVAEGAPDPETGAASLDVVPRLQLAMALGERVGFTADVGFATGGAVVSAPGAALKVLLRAPAPGRTALSLSADLFGSTHSVADVEAGLGLGALRTVGKVTLRAGASLATAVTSFGPHVHAGASAALALGRRWRALGEVVTELSRAGTGLAAGPSVKLALGDSTALMAGALFPLAPVPAAPAVAVQLTRSL